LICVDSSALIAILFEEPEVEQFSDRILSEGDVRVGAPNALEFLMVATSNRADFTAEEGYRFIEELGIVVVGFTPVHLQLATRAFLQFGRGRHPAKLNFGDCMAYALAKSLDAPLLFKGTDFSATDVKRTAP